MHARKTQMENHPA